MATIYKVRSAYALLVKQLQELSVIMVTAMESPLLFAYCSMKAC